MSALLRARILVALGLPTTAVAAACRPVPAQAPSAAPERDAPTGWSASRAASSPGRACAIDEVLESICGQMKSPALQRYPFAMCGATGASIAREMGDEGEGEFRRLIDPFAHVRGSKRAVLSSFSFDAERTHEVAVGSFGVPPVAAETSTYRSSLCCYTRCTRLEVTATTDPIPPGHDVVPTCVPAPQRGTSLPAAGKNQCPAAIRIRGRAVHLVNAGKGECCYATTRTACGPEGYRDDEGQCHHRNRGRPLREHGQVRTAPTHARGGWSSDVRDAGEADLATGPARSAAAAGWARNAAAEHSSVAAFARLSLELLALGAPADLVTACHVAAIDEVEHARLSYGVASRFAGARLGPGPLVLQTAPRGIDLIGLVRETFADGCVGETTAALEGEEAAARVGDGAIASVLRIIARDEASHALLAFRILAWALSVGGEDERRTVEALVNEAERVATTTTTKLPAGVVAPDDGSEALGVTSDAKHAALRLRAVRDVVVPCVRALLA